MKARHILIALAGLVALGSYYYFFEVRKKADDEKAAAAAGKLIPGFDRKKVSSISLANGKDLLTLKKYPAGWMIESPEKFEADQQAVEALLSMYENEAYAEKLDNMDFREAGLTTSTARAVFGFDGGRSTEVVFGLDNPAGQTAYAERPGDTLNAYLVSKGLKDTVKKTVFSLRYKNVLKLDAAKVTRAVFRIKDKDYTIEKKSGTWQFVPPIEEKLKADRIDYMLKTLGEVTARSIIKPSQENIRKYGLESPAEYADFTQEGKDIRIYFGMQEPVKKISRFIRNNQQADIIEMPEYAYSGIAKADEITDRRICTFDQSKAARVEISAAGRDISYEKKVTEGHSAEKWELKKSAAADRETLGKVNCSNMVSAISWLEFREKLVPARGANLANEYGLIPGKNWISVYDGKGALLAGLLIGGSIKGKDEIYVKVSGNDKIYAVDAVFLRNLEIPGLEAK